MASPAKFTEAAPALVDAVEYVNSVSAYDFSLWATVLGPTGQFGVSALCPDFGPFSDEMAQRGREDEIFGSKVTAVGACLDGSPEDTLWRNMHSTGNWSEVPHVLSNVIIEPPAGQFPAVLAWAVDLTSYLGEQHGAVSAVSASAWGRPNSARMIFGYDSVQSFQERAEAAQEDADFNERFAAGAELGQPVNLETNLMRRII
jgi:hypothetical protein